MSVLPLRLLLLVAALQMTSFATASECSSTNNKFTQQKDTTVDGTTHNKPLLNSYLMLLIEQHINCPSLNLFPRNAAAVSDWLDRLPDNHQPSSNYYLIVNQESAVLNNSQLVFLYGNGTEERCSREENVILYRFSKLGKELKVFATVLRNISIHYNVDTIRNCLEKVLPVNPDENSLLDTPKYTFSVSSKLLESISEWSRVEQPIPVNEFLVSNDQQTNKKHNNNTGVVMAYRHEFFLRVAFAVFNEQKMWHANDLPPIELNKVTISTSTGKGRDQEIVVDDESRSGASTTRKRSGLIRRKRMVAVRNIPQPSTREFHIISRAAETASSSSSSFLQFQDEIPLFGSTKSLISSSSLSSLPSATTISFVESNDAIRSQIASCKRMAALSSKYGKYGLKELNKISWLMTPYGFVQNLHAGNQAWKTGDYTKLTICILDGVPSINCSS